MAKKNQNTEFIRKVRVDEQLLPLVTKFADANGMTESEVIREAMAGFVAGQYAGRRRVSASKTIWIDPKDYLAFVNKAKESHVTIRYALETALENYL